MTPQQRSFLVEKETRRAQVLIQQAMETFASGHLDIAVNRCYYACYHLVQGLFINNQESAHTHKGMHVLLYKKFIQPGLLDTKYGSFFARLMQLRQKADYNAVFDIPEEEGSEILNLSKEFISVVGSLITTQK